MNDVRIGSDELGVTIRPLGAEIVSIRHATAGEILWQAGPAWPRHAPVLFPIVGDLANDRYTSDGRSFELGRHGFARKTAFTLKEALPETCTFELTESPATLAHYPFRFVLTIRYSVVGATLVADYTVANPGETGLPASLGAHPAFRWPLVEGAAREAHTLTFAADEPEPIRRLDGRLLGSTRFPTPIEGRTLALRPALFDADAIILDEPRSCSLTYTAPSAPRVEVAWRGFEQLGVWSNGGDFVCIEPWFGHASPVGFDGDFAEKPGLMHVAPGASRGFEMRITSGP